MPVLLKRRLQSSFNSFVSMQKWEFFVRMSFMAAGLAILCGMYFWFYRVLNYLYGISIIGQLLPWKLSSMAFLLMFSMVSISGLIAAMTTLYYSYDLKFLFSSPLSVRRIFFDKTVEASLYSSWTLAAVMVPYIFALGRVIGAGLFFYIYFLALLVPYVLLGAAFGIMLSLGLMYWFPTSRTRDIVWLLGSSAMIGAYMMLRFVQPERLTRPDALEVVSKYLQYLQAPTAKYLPSWWLVGGMQAFHYGRYGDFALCASGLVLSVFALYGLLVYFSKWAYMKGFSGAQEGMRQGPNKGFVEPLERKMIYTGMMETVQGTLLWKDRKLFMRDVRYWSQGALILAIMAVYLFSIRQLPLDSGDLKSLISFLNISVAGFVVASIGLRFTFPSISLEGKSFWILRSSPVSLRSVLKEKLVLWTLPSFLVGTVLVAWSNVLLGADAFISILSLFTIAVASIAFCFMGVGLGAVFPRFNVENIHQIESSAGGFIYMAACIGYLALVLVIESYPVRYHFMGRFYSNASPDWRLESLCALAYVALNAVAIVLPWKLGLKTLESCEI
jgi:ABC-2 type transport system permease protein